jgi:hypothetical protein
MSLSREILNYLRASLSMQWRQECGEYPFCENRVSVPEKKRLRFWGVVPLFPIFSGKRDWLSG